MKINRWLAHLLGWNEGTILTWWQGEHLMVGFKCAECGQIFGVHEGLPRWLLN